MPSHGLPHVASPALSKVPIVDGEMDVNIPAGTQPGTVIRLEGKGAPKLNNVNTRGTHFLTVKVEIPRSLGAKEKELVKQLKDLA